MVRRRAVLQITPNGHTAHPAPLSTTDEIAALRAASAEFMAPSITAPIRPGFFWVDVENGVLEPGSRLTFEQTIDLCDEVTNRTTKETP